MKPFQRSLVFPVAVSAALASFASPFEEIVFAPEEGASVQKTFTSSMTLELDDFSALVDGQDIGAMLGALELDMNLDGTVAVTDEYGASENGRPLSLTRTYDTLDSTGTFSAGTDMGVEQTDTSSSSELEGVTVVFEWDADAEEYVASFPDDADGDTELLDGLSEDMDLRFLLPEGEIAEGETWSVDLSGFEGILSPGGNLKLTSDDAEADDDQFDQVMDGIGDSIEEKIDELLEGDGTCTFAGVTEEDGVRIARIEVSVEISSAVDIAGELEDLIAEFGDPEMGGAVSFDVADINLDVEAEGVLLWNVDAGHVRSFELASSGSLSLDLAAAFEMADQSASAEISVELSFTGRHEVEAE